MCWQCPQSSVLTAVSCLQVEVTRAVAPTGGLPGVAEAPEGVGDALAAAREDHRSRRLLVPTGTECYLLQCKRTMWPCIGKHSTE